MAEVGTHPQYHEYHASQVRVASGLNFLAGLWVIISPWVYGHTGSVGSVWNDVIVGIIVAVLAASRFSGSRAVWPSWVNVLLGIWLIISPWVYGFAFHTARVTNSVIFGIVVIILGLWSVFAGRTEARTTA